MNDATDLRGTAVARLRAGPEAAARDLLARLAEVFDAAGAALSAYEADRGWTVAIHFVEPPNQTAVRALVALATDARTANAVVFETLVAKDWVKESLAGLKPVQAGRFVVHGEHDQASIRANWIGIEIAASLAFGTGHHGTTRGCLLALDTLIRRLRKPRRALLCPLPLRERARKTLNNGLMGEGYRSPHPSPITTRRPAFMPSPARGEGTSTSALHTDRRVQRARRPRRVLDIGTGSGVLAIAAAKALRVPVLASDIDPRAVRIARENTKRNRAPTVTVIHAAGLGAQGFRRRAPFDLVLANILLVPLQQLATPVARLVAPGGRVVLSGLLAAQAGAALAAYRAQGLALERRIVLDGWATLVLRRGRE